MFRYLWGSCPGSWGGLFRELGLWSWPKTPHPTALPPPEMLGVETRPMEYGIDLCRREILVAWQTWFISRTWYNVCVLQCSKTCGEGQQIRAVQCINITSETLASDCDLSAKPAEIQICNPDPCPSGHSGLYLRCSSNVSLFNHVNDLNMLIRNLIFFFSELKTSTCKRNRLNNRVCRKLRQRNQCTRVYVRVNCCRTCELSKYRRWRRPRRRQE